MMKRVISFFLLTSLLLGIFTTAYAKTEYFYDGSWHTYRGNVFRLRVNGELLKTEMPPIVFNNYSVVPARDVFEKMGALVEWDGNTQSVYVSSDELKLSLKINSTVCHVGDTLFNMPIAPKIINEKTMIPVRFVGEMLGYYIDFDSKSDTVIINSRAYQESISATPSPVPTVQDNGDVKVSGASYALNDDGIVLTLPITGKADFSAFYLENPLRLVVDITNASFSSIPQTITLSKGDITSIRFGQNQGIRIVFDVLKKLNYNIDASKNSVNIYVGTNINNIFVPTPTPTPTPPATSSGTPESMETPVPTEEPFYIDIKASGGRDYLETSAKLGEAARYSSPDRVEFEITKNDLPTEQMTKNVGGNFVQTIEYTPVSLGKGKVTLYIKGGSNYNFVQTQGALYIMARKSAKLRSVMIDAGHGGADGGAVGYDENGNIEAKEKDFNLDVALKVREELLKQDIEVHMIRENDIYVDFQQVGSIANDAGTTLFVSIHTNSSVAASPNGIETWAYLEDNASSLNGMTSKRLGELIQKELISQTNAVDRGIKNGKSLAVIKTTSMPAVLVEMGFISNTEERHKLMDETYRQKIATAIASGIIAAFDEMGI